MDLRDWVSRYLELSPPKPLDQSKNVTVRTFHIWPGIVLEHIFLVLGGTNDSNNLQFDGEKIDRTNRPGGTFRNTPGTYVVAECFEIHRGHSIVDILS